MLPTRDAGVAGAAAATPLLSGPLGALLLAAPAGPGAPSFVVHDLAPHALGSPVHTHQHEDEWSYVLSGEVGVELDGETSVAGPGDLVLKPRGVPHAFWNAGDGPARFLEVITPGGFEQYFAALADVLPAGGPPDLAALTALAHRYGLDMDLTSVPRLMGEHGLVGA
jgi:mannose-6-phosphate isomerase-like protein (cupin superfamily)